jgi:two-component system, OmpR family, sensor histidine kinase VicK
VRDFQARSLSSQDRPHDEENSIAEELRQQKAELFAEVTLKIRQSLQLKEILSTTVSEVQRILKADRVLIYQVLPDRTGKTISEAVLPDVQAILGYEFPEEVFPMNYQTLYAKGRVRAIADVSDPKSGVASCLIDFLTQFGIKAKLIVPIVITLNPNSGDQVKNNKFWGLLIAHHCRQAPHDWSEFELELMQQLADQIAIAISQGELLEHLEDMVTDRTAKLCQVNLESIKLRQANLELQQEITECKQTEDALRRSEEQLRSITDALPVLIAYVDAQQNYQFNNQAYEKWLGKSPESIRGKHLNQVWDCYDRMEPWVRKVLSGEVVIYENEIQWIDGTSRSVSVTYIPHQEGKGKQQNIKGFFALITDISDRKAIERMKDEFISVVSHELRTPLTSIHGALKILATGRLGSLTRDGHQMLEIADENTDRLVRLVNGVLDLHRIEAGEVTMNRQICNAADLMVTATETMQAMAQQYDVFISTAPVEVEIWADADDIVQVLVNLLSNSIKFSSREARIELTLTCHINQIQFEVRDRGPGIPPEQLERIFDRFYQVDSSDSRKKGGTGLGLTICRKIIEQHGGRLWAESVLGEGSRFIFTVPSLNHGES